MTTLNDLEYKYYTEALAGNLPGRSLPDDPEFNSVKTGLIVSDDYNVLRSKDGVVLQDDHGDYAYWDRNLGLQLFGQGTVNPSISGNQNIDVIVSGHKNVAFKSTGMKLLSDVDCHDKTLRNLKDGVNDQDAVTVKQLKETLPVVSNFDQIQEGLYNSIKAQDTPVRAMNTLGAALANTLNTSHGVVDCTAEAIGSLVPTELEGGSKYGIFSFEFVHGSSNTMYVRWTDENGKIFQGVWSAQHWFGWSQAVSYATMQEQQLLAGVAGGELYVDQIQVG